MEMINYFQWRKILFWNNFLVYSKGTHCAHYREYLPEECLETSLMMAFLSHYFYILETIENKAFLLSIHHHAVPSAKLWQSG